jgi:hypothetical protein
MEYLDRILKLIVIWTAVLFVPCFALGVLATIVVAVGLGAMASAGTMMGLAVVVFFSPPMLVIWGIGVAWICIYNFFKRDRAKPEREIEY